MSTWSEVLYEAHNIRVRYCFLDGYLYVERWRDGRWHDAALVHVTEVAHEALAKQEEKEVVR